MSIAGFKSQNHPQQTGVRGPLDEVDDRGTDPEFVKGLEARFGQPFTLDVAAAAHNAKAPRYYTRADDGLKQSWAGERVWCNPPYSDLYSWVQKAWAESDFTRGIVMLLPANRPEQKWWQELVEPFRDKADSPLRTEFLPGRMRFSRPDAVIGPKGGAGRTRTGGGRLGGVRMIRVALWLISATSLVALTHTTGWVGLFLAALGFGPLIALIILWRNDPANPLGEARKWDELDPTAHLSTLDRADGIGNRKSGAER